jgi:hypothetical protein
LIKVEVPVESFWIDILPVSNFDFLGFVERFVSLLFFSLCLLFMLFLFFCFSVVFMFVLICFNFYVLYFIYEFLFVIYSGAYNDSAYWDEDDWLWKQSVVKLILFYYVTYLFLFSFQLFSLLFAHFLLFSYCSLFVLLFILLEVEKNGL